MSDFDLQDYVYKLLETIKDIHDESVKNNDKNYRYTHIFSKEEIDNIAEAWDRCVWFEITSV